MRYTGNTGLPVSNLQSKIFNLLPAPCSLPLWQTPLVPYPHSPGFHPGSGAPGAESRVRSCGSQGSGVDNSNIVFIIGKKKPTSGNNFHTLSKHAPMNGIEEILKNRDIEKNIFR